MDRKAFTKAFYDKLGGRSKSTMQSNENALHRVEVAMRTPLEEWTPDMFKDPARFWESMDGYALNTKINSVGAILRWLEFNHGKDNEAYKAMRQLQEGLILDRAEKAREQRRSKKEQDNYVPYEVMRQITEEAVPEYIEMKKSYTSYRNFLITALYTLQVPARSGNWLKMKVRHSSRKPLKSMPKMWNYIGKSDDGYKVVFNQYKTSQYLGQIEHEITEPDLVAVLDKWFNLYNRRGDLFLQNASGSPMSSSNFNNSQQSGGKALFGKPQSTNSYRHAFFTWFLAQNPPLTERDRVARLAGQTYKPSRMELYARHQEPNDPGTPEEPLGDEE